MRIVHLTSAHARDDVRIFHKECCSLAEHGHDVHLLVADGLGDGALNGVHIHDVGKLGRNHRSLRMLRATWRFWQKGKALHPNLVHIHDPELLPLLLLLQSSNVRAIYDAHEDLPRQVLSKPWIPAWMRPVASRIVEVMEDFLVRRLDAIVAPTTCIRQRFESLGVRVAEVRNYPILEHFGEPRPWDARSTELCYVGAISRARGLVPLVRAMEGSDVPLNIAGCWNESGLREELQALPGWALVRELGVLDRPDVVELMGRCKIGIVTLLPVTNYIQALPVKLFEYMAAGLPVIASDFPLWREIVESAKCGLLVDPEDPQAIRAAASYLLSHGEEARAMGTRGRSAVMTSYQWMGQSLNLRSLIESFEGI